MVAAPARRAIEAVNKADGAAAGEAISFESPRHEFLAGRKKISGS